MILKFKYHICTTKFVLSSLKSSTNNHPYKLNTMIVYSLYKCLKQPESGDTEGKLLKRGVPTWGSSKQSSYPVKHLSKISHSLAITLWLNSTIKV